MSDSWMSLKIYLFCAKVLKNRNSLQVHFMHHKVVMDILAFR